MWLRLDDLSDNEREQFEKAIVEGDSGIDEWVTLMWMATVNGGYLGGNQGAFERRQAIRRLYQSERRARRDVTAAAGKG